MSVHNCAQYWLALGLKCIIILLYLYFVHFSIGPAGIIHLLDGAPNRQIKMLAGHIGETPWSQHLPIARG